MVPLSTINSLVFYGDVYELYIDVRNHLRTQSSVREHSLKSSDELSQVVLKQVLMSL